MRTKNGAEYEERLRAQLREVERLLNAVQDKNSHIEMLKQKLSQMPELEKTVKALLSENQRLSQT